VSSNGKVTWTNERRRLGDLQPWPRNPRQIKTDQAKRLVESFDQFGQVETIAIGPAGEIYNGHQRLNVLMDKYGADYEVDVRSASRALTEKEREKLTVFLHKGAAGEWDFDTLSEWDTADLIEWGFKEYELGIVGDPNDPDAEWKGMPEFEQEDKSAYQSIHVHFKDKREVEEFSILINQPLTNHTRAIWYSKHEKAVNSKLRYVDDT
jgi:hypothetical protein